MKKYSRFLALLICMLAIIPHALAGDPAIMSEVMKHRMKRATMVPDAMQNPGFEDAGAAGSLPGWTATVHAGDRYRIEPDQGQVFSGKRSLVIENIGEPEWGGVVQVFRAEGLAGREVELSARLKMQGVTAPGFYMMLKTKQMGLDLKSEKTQDKFVGDSDWKKVSLRTTLPKETTHLEVMLMLAGDGRVWVDDARVDQLAEKK